MPPELFRIVQLIVVAFMLFVVVMMLWRTGEKLLRRSRQSGKGKPSSRAASAPSLSKKVKVEGEITSNAATLVAWCDSSKDEFLGLVDVLDGHHTGAAATDRHNRDAVVIKTWQFLGFGDRFDARNRQRDFDRLRQMFRSETQSIIAEYRQQGWWVKTISSDVYHLSR